MEKPLNINLLLPLKDIVLRRVVVNLWTQRDVIVEMECSRKVLKAFLEKGEQVVENKLSELAFSKLMLKVVMPLIKPIGLEMINWTDFHVELLGYLDRCFDFYDPHKPPDADGDVSEKPNFERINYSNDVCNRNVLENLSWSFNGTIKYRKTVEEFIRLETLDCIALFKLACWYCLEEHIPVLFEKLPAKIKTNFYSSWQFSITTQSCLDAFWFFLMNKDDRLHHGESHPFQNITKLHQHAFSKSALSGNKSATEYFYQKLTSAEEETTLIKTADDVAKKRIFHVRGYPTTAPKQKLAEVFHYLLTLMTHQQRLKCFKTSPHEVLLRFLIWPWQDLFLNIAKHAHTFLSRESYHDLLQLVSTTETISGYIKVDLFKEFFLLASDRFKSHFVVEQRVGGYFLYKFFVQEELEIVKCILRNIDPNSRKSLIFCNQGLDICRFLMEENKWQLRKLFIDEAMLSEEDMEQLKLGLKAHVSANCREGESICDIEDWERLFCMFFETDGSGPSKRSLEDEKVAKKLCTEDRIQ